MNEQERERLRTELSELCLACHPSKGPHQWQEVTQRFDYYYMDQADRVAQQRAGALEYAEAQNPTQTPSDRDQSAQAINQYFDRKQEYIDRQVDRAFLTTCEANGFSLPDQAPEQARVEAALNAPDASRPVSVYTSSVDQAIQREQSAGEFAPFLDNRQTNGLMEQRGRKLSGANGVASEDQGRGSQDGAAGDQQQQARDLTPKQQLTPPLAFQQKYGAGGQEEQQGSEKTPAASAPTAPQPEYAVPAWASQSTPDWNRGGPRR